MTEEEKQSVASILSTPDGYASLVLKMKLHPTHAKVLQALFSTPTKDELKSGVKPNGNRIPSKVAAVCGNSCGKTTSIIVAAVLYAIAVRNALVVATSSSHNQLTTQMVSALKRYAGLFPKWEFLENKIKVNGVEKFIGIATDEGERRFQGYHETTDSPLLIVVDEAAGVAEPVYHAIQRCKPTWLLMAGSPLGPEGYFYNCHIKPESRQLFKHFKLTQFDCLKKDGFWLDKDEIDKFVAEFGEKHPLVLSSVYAQFVETVEGAIVTLSELERCLQNPPTPNYSLGRHCAIDFAAGGDANVISLRRGNVITIIDRFTERDTVKAARRITDTLNQLKDEYGLSPSEVSGDADGLGLPMCDQLKANGWSINYFHGNSPSEKKEYRNRIAECYLELANKIKQCQLVFTDNNHLKQFKLEITGRKSYMNQSGKLQLESKDDMRARGVKSPDVADTIAMCSMPAFSGQITNVFMPKPNAGDPQLNNTSEPGNWRKPLTSNQFNRMF